MNGLVLVIVIDSNVPKRDDQKFQGNGRQKPESSHSTSTLTGRGPEARLSSLVPREFEVFQPIELGCTDYP